MIPRIVQPSRTRHDKSVAFGRGENARPLRIFVDEANVAESEWLDLIYDFAQHDQIEVVSSDRRASIKLTIEPYDHQNVYAPTLYEFPDGVTSHSGVPGPDIPQIGREFAGPGREDEGERAMILAISAEDNGCDALVTESDLLLDAFPRNIVRGANAMSAREAVALIGLFLRVREDFVFDIQGKFKQGFDRGLFYFVLMRVLLSSSWRWFSGCVTHSNAVNDEHRVLLTAQAAMERMERALRARDRMHEKLQLPPSRDAITEAIFYFDVTLMMLGGTFDVLARIAHEVHQLKGSARSASWGGTPWMKKLAHANATLAGLMAVGQPHRDARELVAVLRNTIHSQMFQSITFQSGGRRDELVVVPKEVEKDLEDTLTRLGGLEQFGVSREHGRLYIEPGTYVEAALPLVAAAANAIMDSTPVEQLAGVKKADLMAGPPDDNVFGSPIRKRVAQLGGVDWTA